MGLKEFLIKIIGSVFLPVLLFLEGCSGGAVEGQPVSLPVPFSGSLTPDTNVLIAEGNSVGGSVAFRSFFVEKSSQDNAQFPISWELFDSVSGVSNGTVTFNSMSHPELSPAPGGGIKRVYTMDACATIGLDREACSDNFKCFDLPTDYTPSADVVNFSSTIPGTTPEVRKLYCSGNINFNDIRNMGVTEGQLLDGKFVIGSACFSGDQDCIFHSQLESAVFIHGTPFSPLEGNPDGNVVSTIITQGGILPVPNNPLGINIPVLIPGSVEKIGDLFGTSNSFQELAPDAGEFETNFDAEFRMIDGSRLVVHHVDLLTHRLPELDEIVRNTLQTNFADAPGVTPRLLKEGVLFFNTTGESHSDLINCDPAVGEATGTFQALCGRFPRMRVNFLCTAAGLTDLNAIDGFMFSGVWTIVRE